MALSARNTDSEVQFGPLKLKQKTMSVLLVFSREDAQSDGFWWAAERGGYKCNLTKSHDGALECFLDKQQEVVIIDHRHNKSFDAEALCRSIRATKASEHTVIVAVTKKYDHSDLAPISLVVNTDQSDLAPISLIVNTDQSDLAQISLIVNGDHPDLAPISLIVSKDLHDSVESARLTSAIVYFGLVPD